MDCGDADCHRGFLVGAGQLGDDGGDSAIMWVCVCVCLCVGEFVLRVRVLSLQVQLADDVDVISPQAHIVEAGNGICGEAGNQLMALSTDNGPSLALSLSVCVSLVLSRSIQVYPSVAM